MTKTAAASPARVLEPRVELRMFLRLLLLQSTWSFERMQGLGFAYALEPWLKKIYKDPADQRAALERHAEYFNTQPYAASLILGLVCAMEEEAAGLPPAKRPAALERMRAVKRATGAALAGLGDAFFWSALRPAAASAALFTGLFVAHAGWAQAGLAMALTYLVAYNVPALWLRWSGISLGYEWREQLPARLKGFELQTWVKRLRQAGTGLALACVVLMGSMAAEPALRMFGAAVFVVSWAAYLLLPGRVSAARLYAAALALALLAALTGTLKIS